ncbi:MAG: LytTR family DNA-binding domain-containing protein [Paracoccaceae bacterium]
MRVALGHPVLLPLWISVSLVATIAGPFETGACMTLAERSVFWPTITGSAILLEAACRVARRRLLPDAGPMQSEAFLILGMVAFYTPVTWLVLVPFLDHDTWHHPYPEMLLHVAVIGFSISSTRLVMQRVGWARASSGPGGQSGDTSETDPKPRLTQRLSNLSADEILAVSADDHYIDVRALDGTERVLLRFSDALNEMEGLEGVRVHRSHWVARGAVKGARRDNGRVFLDLVDGSTIPVSRKYREEVARAGWL